VRPFVGIADLRVPGGKDGEAMLRLAARFPALPIIVVTAFPDALPPLVPSGFFPKPFDTALLLEAVERQYAARRPQ
jgi:DNA-binding NarL/FixJ family response regulator